MLSHSHIAPCNHSHLIIVLELLTKSQLLIAIGIHVRLHIPILYHLGDCNGQWASRTRRPETTVHTYSQSYTHTVSRTHVQSVVNTYSQSYTRTVSRTHIQSVVHTYSQSYTRTVSRTHVQSVVHTYSQSYTVVHTYSQSYTRTVSRTHVQSVIHAYSVLAFSSHRANEPFHSFFGFDFQLSPSVLELNLSLTKNN